jgi:release factor glutamine methyltransferase
MNAHRLHIGPTIVAARRALAAAFRAEGLDTPEIDARILVGGALDLDHAAMASDPERMLERAETERIAAFAQRRLAREPVARILGRSEFWSLEFQLAPHVLQPRPETETLIEAALAHLRAMPATPAIRIADLGTGSGIILVALLHELARATGTGTDRSAAALALARANACRLGVADRAEFVMGDFGSALSGGYHLIVSNPPYIRSDEIPDLAPEVRLHDPHLALDGGPDGLAAYRAIAGEAVRLLQPGGALIVEIGAGQAAAVVDLFTKSGLRVVTPPRADAAGIPRAIVAIPLNQTSRIEKKGLGLCRQND